MRQALQRTARKRKLARWWNKATLLITSYTWWYLLQTTLSDYLH